MGIFWSGFEGVPDDRLLTISPSGQPVHNGNCCDLIGHVSAHLPRCRDLRRLRRSPIRVHRSCVSGCKNGRAPSKRRQADVSIVTGVWCLPKGPFDVFSSIKNVLRRCLSVERLLFALFDKQKGIDVQKWRIKVAEPRVAIHFARTHVGTNRRADQTVAFVDLKWLLYLVFWLDKGAISSLQKPPLHLLAGLSLRASSQN